jgi:hypothetical protein
MTRRRDEIIEEIVDNLRPWKGTGHAVLEAVDLQMDLLRDADAAYGNEGSLPRGAECKKAAEKLSPALSALTEVLDGLPANIDNILFEQFAEPLGGPSSHAEFTRQLRVLQKASNLLEHVKAPSKNADLTKGLCAGTAHGIIGECSRKPPTGTPDAPLRTIASLLFEVLTGQRGRDLKRACDDQLKRRRTFNEQVRTP